jgi:hypothetical protein
VPAEEVLLPAESNQAQVADGQVESFTALLNEANLAILEADPNIFGDEALHLNCDVSAAQPQQHPQPMSQYRYGDIFDSHSSNGQMPSSDPSQHNSHPGSQSAFNYPMQWD